MRLPTLFKQNKNKSYNYSPRYYNERKERIQNLIAKKENPTDKKDFFKRNASRSFREDWRRKKSVQMDRNRRLRFMVIFILLLFFFYAAVKMGAVDIII